MLQKIMLADPVSRFKDSGNIHFKIKFLLFFGAAFTLVSGLILMASDTEPYGYGLKGLTIGPICVVTAFVLFLPAILYSPGSYPQKIWSEHWPLRIGGWFVFAVSLLIYAFCAERTVSFWDCGEFIAAAYKLQIPHPPGAPLFLLLGRLFSMLAPTTEWVAYCINLVSVLSSALTVYFIYRSLNIIIQKIFRNRASGNHGYDLSTLIGSITGSLALAFSDSFWFNAEEAEVYALSCLFTSAVFYAILRWDAVATQRGSEKWLLLIAYLTGLSIGVHLLSLIAIPAVAAVIYFRLCKASTKGVLIVLAGSLLLVFVIMSGVITGLLSLAARFEVFFVNTLELPFSSGAVCFAFLLVVFTGMVILWPYQNRYKWLSSCGAAFALLMIGYSSYFVVLIRSNYNPPLDENNPEDVMSLISYLNREQYGTRPFLRGPQYSASDPIEVIKEQPNYIKDEKLHKYIVGDYDYKYLYRPQDIAWFPRMYSSEARHKKGYSRWVKVRDGKTPAFFQNLEFFLTYQLGHMYWRYFLWNFSGRQSDVQHAEALFISRRKDLSQPEALQNNKARNYYYLLPLCFGLLGLMLHFWRQPKDAWVILLLFVFGGIAIVVYLNQPPEEPRERDYAYVASYYAFCMWIGIGGAFVTDLLQKVFGNVTRGSFAGAVAGLLVPVIMLAENYDYHNRKGRYFAADTARNVLSACAPNAILFAAADNDTFPLWYMQEVEGFRTDVRICNLSLLNTEWYIECMKRWSNASAPLPISLMREQYRKGKNEHIPLVENPNLSKGIHLNKYLELVNKTHPLLQYSNAMGTEITVIPSRKLLLKTLGESVFPKPAVKVSEPTSNTPAMEFHLPGGLNKSELIVFDIISTNNWSRPIYFHPNAVHEHKYFKKYLSKVGFVLQLTPNAIAEEPWIDTRAMYHNMMHGSSWRGLDDPKVLVDPASLPFIALYRIDFAELANQLVIEGDKVKAKEVLQYSLQVIPGSVHPFDQATADYPDLLWKVGLKQEANRMATDLCERAHWQLLLKAMPRQVSEGEAQTQLYVLYKMIEYYNRTGQPTLSNKYQPVFEEYYKKFYPTE